MRYVAVVLLLSLVAACGDEQPASPAPDVAPTATAAPAGETLAFLRDGRIRLVQVETGDERALPLTGVESFSWVSADEIDAVTGTPNEVQHHLLVDLEGNARELPSPAGGSWSRDGRRYVVVVDEQLVVFDRDGSEVARLDVEPPVETGPKPRPCERTLPGGSPNLIGFGRPAFSPDGQRVLVAVNCVSRAGANTFFKPVVEVALDGTVTSVTSLRVNTEAAPRFSPDGMRIAQADAFHLNACAYAAILVVAGAGGMNGEVIEPAELSRFHEQQRTPSQVARPVPLGGVVGYDWAPGSDAIVASVNVSLCANPGSEPEPFLAGLYILRLDGTEAKIVDGQTHSPAWSPSGREIAYVLGDVGDRVGEGTIRIVGASDGRPRADLWRGSQPAWQPATSPPSP